MERPTFMGFTVGNWVQIALIVVGGVVAFTTVQGEQRAMQAQLSRLEQTAASNEQRIGQNSRDLETRIRAVEVLQASQSSDLRNIQIGINEIKAGLERLARDGEARP